MNLSVLLSFDVVRCRCEIDLTMLKFLRYLKEAIAKWTVFIRHLIDMLAGRRFD